MIAPFVSRTSRMALTRQQRLVFEAIKQSWRERRYSPTYRDLMQLTGIRHRNAIAGHLNRLEAKGVIRIHRNLCRGIELVEDDGCCPLCGTELKKD